MSFSYLRVAVLVEQNDLAVMNVVQIPETDIGNLRVTLRHLGADPVLGLVGKYKFAWDATVNSLLEEADFFSLAHLLGPDTELESSILLAQHCYYKQAKQILRNLLEGAALQLYFSVNRRPFMEWREGEGRVPPV